MGYLSPLLKSLNPFKKLLLMPRVGNRFPVFILCLSTAFLVSRLYSSQYEGSLITQSVFIPFKKYKYSFVHEAFRRHNQAIHKFVTNDTSYSFTNYVMKQNMVWDHCSVCSNDTFVFLFYLVSQKDYERRQVIREYVKQNMTVDGKQINYMIVVATDDKTVISGLGIYPNSPISSIEFLNCNNSRDNYAMCSVQQEHQRGAHSMIRDRTYRPVLVSYIIPRVIRNSLISRVRPSLMLLLNTTHRVVAIHIGVLEKRGD